MPRARSAEQSSTRATSRTRSRSRSRSRGRKPTPARAAEVKTKVVRSPARKPKKSESEPVTPVRTSRRLKEKVVEQIMVLKTSNGDQVPSSVEESKPVPELEIAKPSPIASAPFVASAPFGGPLGGALLTVLLPVIVLYITIACTKSSCSLTALPRCPASWSAFFGLEAFGVVLAWYVFQAVLAFVPIGSVVKGQPLKDGTVLHYRCNGRIAFAVTTLLFGVLYQKGYPMDYINTNWLKIVTAGVVYSFLLATFVYLKALRASSNALAAGSTGSLFNDFFMGRELNPRLGTFDLKFFFELRPGLMGWCMIIWCLVASQYKLTGAVNPALAMVVLFQTMYVFDALINEAAILTTLDITTEGFGFMLAFGDIAWVPYLYSLQARFLYDHPNEAVSHPYALAAICILEVIGLVIFRGANRQKDEFRNNPYNPALASLQSIPTSSGKRLLCSGFWGICRRPNYLGDLLMSVAWSLPCGFHHALPYFYPIYFFVLLVHRCMRDEAHCKKRYGEAWVKYTEAVPYKIIPYVY